MSSHGTKGLYGIKTSFLDLIYRADRELCMDQDEWAYRLGWTVTTVGFGARRYRDPRFDLLKAARATAPALALAPVPDAPVPTPGREAGGDAPA
ncbi:hypothetical protein GCM10010517_43260 [Streptosporangium fragile]|uniref:Uncharacterized protein n=1 Tax=Streptosporangium fragile TaxID=46186 RepID=A0ABN3W115_9ACTN